MKGDFGPARRGSELRISYYTALKNGYVFGFL
jgi:hypothetical protein